MKKNPYSKKFVCSFSFVTSLLYTFGENSWNICKTRHRRYSHNSAVKPKRIPSLSPQTLNVYTGRTSARSSTNVNIRVLNFRASEQLKSIFKCKIYWVVLKTRSPSYTLIVYTSALSILNFLDYSLATDVFVMFWKTAPNVVILRCSNNHSMPSYK